MPTSRSSTGADAARAGRERGVGKGAGARVTTENGGAVIPMSLVGVRVEVPTNQPIVLLREDRRPALPADLHRPARGHRDRLRAPGHGHAAADDPRPLQDACSTISAPSSTQVVITELPTTGTFYAEIELGATAQATHRISSRPSDAIALAVRYADAGPDLRRARRCSTRRACSSSRTRRRSRSRQFREFLDEVRPEDFAQARGAAAALRGRCVR